MRERIEAFQDAVLRTRTCEDRKAIHDLRVASRRLVAFLRTWRGLLPNAGFRRIVRELRVVRRRVGRARDAEVQVEVLRERLGRHGAPDEDALEFLRDREGRLERRRHRAAKQVRPRRSERLLALLSRAEQGMSTDLVSRLQAFEAAHGRERKRRQIAIDAMRASLEGTDDAALHQARIAIKKWRYAVECLGEDEAPLAGITLIPLRELQQVLGAVRDRATLRAVVSRRLDGLGHRRMSRTLRSVTDDLESERGEAWERFRALGREFLRGAEQTPATSMGSNPAAVPRVSGGSPPP